ncbi:MAG: hypothetical protein C0402_06325 [Thermodesulfovibrio sp.]|nr:hypothetical protein [Thermodesulfovibrio sp.]
MVKKEAEPGIIQPPKTFFLELTNHCNLRCSMCNFHSPQVIRRREKGFMDTASALRLLDEISTFTTEKPWIALHGAGEPLLHKDIVSILAHGASYDFNIGFLTNAVLLDRALSERILDAGISWIGFSIDGTDKTKFEKYRCGADYDQVVRNALQFIDLAQKRDRPVRIMVNMTMQDEMKEDVTAFVRFWSERVREVCVSPFRPIGTRDNVLARTAGTLERVPCYMLSTMMVVFWSGDVGLCCEDWFNDGQMGNAFTEGLSQIWTGEKFSRYRALDRLKKHAEIPLCADCNSWYNAVPQTYFDDALNATVTKTAWQYSYVRKE